MDNLHAPLQRSKWISPDPIHLEDYFSAYRSAIERTRPGVGFRTDLRRLGPTKWLKWLNLGVSNESEAGDATQGIDLDTMTELEKTCHVDNLTVPGELPIMIPTLPGPEESDVTRFKASDIPEAGPELLNTLVRQTHFRANATKYDRYRHYRGNRHPNTNWFDATPQVAPNRTTTKNTESEIVITVRVYKPYDGRSSAKHSSVAAKHLKYAQEILMLGSNKLSELRDFIKCPADHFITDDVSFDPRVARHKQKTTQERYRSGFFYIEGCFYSDYRWPDCQDLSETVRTWAESRDRGLGPFTTAKMEDITLHDLQIRFGYPYVYVHQGHHEHLFSFNDARLMSFDDPQYPAAYPLERSQGGSHCKYCMICSLNVAKWITKDNERVPEDPFLFCDECFHAFNYDANGHKIGHFKAFPFVDSNAI